MNASICKCFLLYNVYMWDHVVVSKTLLGWVKVAGWKRVRTCAGYCIFTCNKCMRWSFIFNSWTLMLLNVFNNFNTYGIRRWLMIQFWNYDEWILSSIGFKFSTHTSSEYEHRIPNNDMHIWGNGMLFHQGKSILWFWMSKHSMSLSARGCINFLYSLV